MGVVVSKSLWAVEDALRLISLDEFAADMRDATRVEVCKLELQLEEHLVNRSHRLRVIVTYRPTLDSDWCCEVVEGQVTESEINRAASRAVPSGMRVAMVNLLSTVLVGMLSGIMPAMTIDAVMARSGLGVKSRALVAPEVQAVTLR